MKDTHVGFTVNGVCENFQKLLWEGWEHLSPDYIASIIMYNTLRMYRMMLRFLSKPVYIFVCIDVRIIIIIVLYIYNIITTCCQYHNFSHYFLF